MSDDTYMNNHVTCTTQVYDNQMGSDSGGSTPRAYGGRSFFLFCSLFPILPLALSFSLSLFPCASQAFLDIDVYVYMHCVCVSERDRECERDREREREREGERH